MPTEDSNDRLEVTEAAFDAMRAERDRFAFEKAELNAVITQLKEQVRGEQAAKEKAQNELNVTRDAWKSTILTKDALAQITPTEEVDTTSRDGVLHLYRAYLATLNDEERAEFFYESERGFCASCGRKLGDDEIRGCQCSNDE